MQRKYKEGDSYCALGAIGISEVETEELQASCVGLLCKFIPAHRDQFNKLLGPETQVTRYNDGHLRTQSQILDLFDRAIANSMNGSV